MLSSQKVSAAVFAACVIPIWILSNVVPNEVAVKAASAASGVRLSPRKSLHVPEPDAPPVTVRSIR
jgi:hypothetical protein